MGPAHSEGDAKRPGAVWGSKSLPQGASSSPWYQRFFKVLGCSARSELGEGSSAGSWDWSRGSGSGRVPIRAHPPAPAVSRDSGCPTARAVQSTGRACHHLPGRHSDPQSCRVRGDQPLGFMVHIPERIEKPSGLALPRVGGGRRPGSSHVADPLDLPEPAWSASLHGTTLPHCPSGTQTPTLSR